MMSTRLSTYITACSAVILLSSCSMEPAQPPRPPVPLTPAMERQVVQLETAKIKVIQQGDRLTMIIPTDTYFEPLTTQVKRGYRDNLHQMARFTKHFAEQYPGAAVRVIGYTDQVFGEHDQYEISQDYASAISAYLFNAGIPQSQLATEGRGSKEPVANSTQPTSMAMNRRVVVQVN